MLPSSSFVANTAYPPADAIEPCGCSEYDMGTIKLDCSIRKLNDSRVSYVLDAFLTTPGISPVGFLDLWVNQITRIPNQIKSFRHLTSFNLQYNPSITSIESGAFNFPDASNFIQMLFYLELQSNFDDCTRSIQRFVRIYIIPSSFYTNGLIVHWISS